MKKQNNQKKDINYTILGDGRRHLAIGMLIQQGRYKITILSDGDFTITEKQITNKDGEKIAKTDKAVYGTLLEGIKVGNLNGKDVWENDYAAGYVTSSDMLLKLNNIGIRLFILSEGRNIK